MFPLEYILRVRTDWNMQLQSALRVLYGLASQVLSIVAMEPPVSLSAEDVRNEKVKVLRCVAPIVLSDVVVVRTCWLPRCELSACTVESVS